MKTKLMLLALTIFLSASIDDQQNPELAFSKSYAFEYETQYAKAIAVLLDNPESYEINLRLGWLHYLSKDYIKAESYYKKAVALEPSSIEARFGMVLPMAALNNWNNVLAVYLEVLKLDPQNTTANFRVATMYYNRKEYNAAQMHVGKVLKLYPFDYDSNLLLGKIFMALGKNSDAKKPLSKALEFNPASDEVKALLKKI